MLKYSVGPWTETFKLKANTRSCTDLRAFCSLPIATPSTVSVNEFSLDFTDNNNNNIARISVDEKNRNERFQSCSLIESRSLNTSFSSPNSTISFIVGDGNNAINSNNKENNNNNSNKSNNNNNNVNVNGNNNDKNNNNNKNNNNTIANNCNKRSNINNMAQNFKQKLNRKCDRFVEIAKVGSQSDSFRNRRHSITFSDSCLAPLQKQQIQKPQNAMTVKINGNANNKVMSKASKLPPSSSTVQPKQPLLQQQQQQQQQQQRKLQQRIGFPTTNTKELTKKLGNVTKKILPRAASLERTTLLRKSSVPKANGIITNGTIMDNHSINGNGKGLMNTNGTIQRRLSMNSNSSILKSPPANKLNHATILVPKRQQPLKSQQQQQQKNIEKIMSSSPTKVVPAPTSPSKIVFVVPVNAQQIFGNGTSIHLNGSNPGSVDNNSQLLPPPPPAPVPSLNSQRAPVINSNMKIPSPINVNQIPKAQNEAHPSSMPRASLNSININGTPTPIVGYIVPASSVIDISQNYLQQQQLIGCQEFPTTSSNVLLSNGIKPDVFHPVHQQKQPGRNNIVNNDDERMHNAYDSSSLRSNASIKSGIQSSSTSLKSNDFNDQQQLQPKKASIVAIKPPNAVDINANPNANLSLRRRIRMPANSSDFQQSEQQKAGNQQQLTHQTESINGYDAASCSTTNGNGNNNGNCANNSKDLGSVLTRPYNNNNRNLNNRPLSAPQSTMTITTATPFNSNMDSVPSAIHMQNSGNGTLRRGQSTIAHNRYNPALLLSSTPSPIQNGYESRNILVIPTNNISKLNDNKNELNGEKKTQFVRMGSNNNIIDGQQRLDQKPNGQLLKLTQQQRHCLQKDNSTEFPVFINEMAQNCKQATRPASQNGTETDKKLDEINHHDINMQRMIGISHTLPPPREESNPTPVVQNGSTFKALNGQKSLPNGSFNNSNGVNGNMEIAASFNANGVVVVRIPPDVFQQSGLTMTGGADCAHPVIISRIASCAAIPLNEGDQVLKINGQDISRWTQAEVTLFLRKMYQKPQELILVIKPNVYRCGGLVDEDETMDQCNLSLTEAFHVADTVPRSDKLAYSMTLLKSMLESDRLNAHFEQIYRKRPGTSMDAAHSAENLSKNRYRDVCPYDSTRVKLRNLPTGNYINANTVNMEIKSSGIVNRYIATQGPLPHTTADFWWMVWEQSSTTIVMLTTLIEKGRTKCHQYWPKCKETFEFGNLSVITVSERNESHCCYREFSIRHRVSREERRVTQMQYTAWPDHGVPENSRHFTKFVAEVRSARNGSIEPIIVHCSAGIGRTGVLIMMETAVCMIEANEPVYPLDILKTMRDQRAMLIQTIDQFAFVCESILRAFNERSVKPLAEYQRG